MSRELHMSAMVQTTKLHVYELNEDTQNGIVTNPGAIYEIEVDCLGSSDFLTPFPLKLYFGRKRKANELDELHQIYVPGSLLRVEGEYREYNIYPSNEVRIVIYDPVIDELSEEEIYYAQSAFGDGGNYEQNI